MSKTSKSCSNSSSPASCSTPVSNFSFPLFTPKKQKKNLLFNIMDACLVFAPCLPVLRRYRRYWSTEIRWYTLHYITLSLSLIYFLIKKYIWTKSQHPIFDKQYFKRSSISYKFNAVYFFKKWNSSRDRCLLVNTPSTWLKLFSSMKTIIYKLK